MRPPVIDPSSFRDPSGFIFTNEEVIYRAISPPGLKDLHLLQNSGLYETLVGKQQLLPHVDAENFLPKEFSEYTIIKPKRIPFISYPYEWCFSQLKEAALLTLDILNQSLDHGIILKDASAYNVQYIGCKPVFIDTLSFEKYEEGHPWTAYKQFCQHFLAPLALMSYKLPELSGLLKNFIDGIPLNITSSLLPNRALLNSGIASHIMLHSKIQQTSSGKDVQKKTAITISKKNLLALVQHLNDCITGLTIKKKISTWSEYENNNSYANDTQTEKEKIIASWLDKKDSKIIWDMGCNTGHYSRIAAKQGEYVLSMDMDFHCIENLFHKLKDTNSTNILPLWTDMSNPAPSIGWANNERRTISQRGRPDTVLALALIHHLRIGNNVPLSMISKYFSEITTHLIIEFVPKEDPMVRQMLATRKDIFSDYTSEGFSSAFEKNFQIHEIIPLPDSGRLLYRMTAIKE